MREDLSVITKNYDLILWSIPLINKFPRTYRFVLGDRIENLLLDVLELFIEAVYTKNKVRILRQCNLKLEKLRYLYRLIHDLKIISGKSYQYAANKVNELGQLVGGWIKQQKNEKI